MRDNGYVVPEPLRCGRLIPLAYRGARSYAMIDDPVTGVKISARAAGAAHRWWPWEPDADAYVRDVGAELAAAPDGPALRCLDLDVPVSPGGVVVADGMRTLADLAALRGVVLDTTGWLLLKTPGHVCARKMKGPGWHAWFTDDRAYPARTGAVPRHPEIELKWLATCPGSPDYGYAPYGRCPDVLPVLPRWIAELFGRSVPGSRTTGAEGESGAWPWGSAPPLMRQWARRWEHAWGDARR